MSTNDTLADITKYLQPIRDQKAMEKQAAEGSYQDSNSNNVEGNDKKVATDKQTNLGLEQSGDAKDSGSTVEDESGNSDDMGKKVTDNQGTQTMDIDQPITSNGNIGSITEQHVGSNQKTASEVSRVRGLANIALGHLQKIANDNNTDNAQPVAGMEKSAAEVQADAFAAEAREAFLMGMQKRASDRQMLLSDNKWQKEIELAGGVDALLDKIAMEEPGAVLPPEALEGGLEGGVEGELPTAVEDTSDASIESLPDEGGAPAPIEGEGAGLDEAELDEVSATLAEAGVTEEDLAMALADIEELQANGVNPEELAQALSEGSAEAAGGTEEDPEAAAGGEVEKEASAGLNRERVNAIKTFLFA